MNGRRALLLCVTTVLCSCQSPRKVDSPELPFQLTRKITPSSLRWDQFPNQTPAEAKLFIAARSEAIANLLAPLIDPYQGTDSTPALCRLENLPPPVALPHGTLHSFYSSQNQVLGLCGDLQQLIKTQYLIMYCEKNQTVYILRYFYNLQDEWLKQPIANCT